MDPTWTKTCPCGVQVSVNQMGQHHHNDCDHNPLHPDCCDDPNVKRRFWWMSDAGTECENCGHVWRGDQIGWEKGLADRMTAPGRFLNGPLRGIIYEHNRRILSDGGSDTWEETEHE